MLYQLKWAGMAQHNFVRVYVSVIRPVLECSCPVWHTGLPDYLSLNIEVVKTSPEVYVPWPELLGYFTSKQKTFPRCMTGETSSAEAILQE